MKIIKFEKSLFDSISGYEMAIQTLKKNYSNNQIAIVIPSDSTTEEILSSIVAIALDGTGGFEEKLQALEERFLHQTRALIPVQEQSSALSFIKQRFNELEKIYKGVEIIGECPPNVLSALLCYASTICSYIFSASASGKGLKVKWMDSRESMKIKNEHGNLEIDIAEKFSLEFHNKSDLKSYVFAGGIGHDSKGKHVHLKKGGEDKTSAALAIVLEAKSIESWTLSRLLMTADPDLVKNAKPIIQLNYEEAIELSLYDLTIMYPTTLSALMEKKIPISIRAINDHENHGTLISGETKETRDYIKGISSLKEISLLNIEGSGMIGIPGFSKKIFSTLNEAGINIILITQGASEHSICIGVNKGNEKKAKELLDSVFGKEIEAGTIRPISSETDLSIIALVGNGMKDHPGISGKMFSALGKNGINIRAIAQGSNERNISAVIKHAELEKALNVLHEVFFEKSKKELNLFIIGTGNVGKKLIDQLLKQSEKIERTHQLKINLAGVCNSRKMLFPNQNILVPTWQEELDKGEKSDMASFTEKMIAMNLRNSVLVDITANQLVTHIYPKTLSKSISVVACNKIAASGKFTSYNALKELAVAYNAKFLFETNVGAALPIISTINDIIKSGDRIIRIDAVLSGTLNYVFNNYDGKDSFSSIVRKAQQEGYTEPDPRLDLGGIDVMRKIMILARECGNELEIEDVNCDPFLPPSCMKGTVDDFYAELGKNEAHFRMLLENAKKDNAKLKFVATLNEGRAFAGLKHIKNDNEMYHLYGKDNIVLIKTERYSEQPLVIKGAGAGAEVTASGIFADILRTINN